MSAKIFNLDDYRPKEDDDDYIEVEEGSDLDIAMTFVEDSVMYLHDHIMNILIDEGVLDEIWRPNDE